MMIDLVFHLSYSLILVAFYISRCEGTCQYQISGREANAFLRSVRHSPIHSSLDCCDESVCESNSGICMTEYWKRVVLKSQCTSPCPSGFQNKLDYERSCHYRCCSDIDECKLQTPRVCKNGASCTNTYGSFICSCAPGYQGRLCEQDVDECQHSPCMNGATCINTDGSFRCNCSSGFEGTYCEKDIDECEYSPCKNGSTCINEFGTFRCSCAEGFYGVLCDADVCHPTPADVVFLLDSSISMTEEQFQKQLDFVVNFTNHVTGSPTDFQIGVVTFSFKSHVEFYLNNHTNNAALKTAVKAITYKPGATFTNKAIEKLQDIYLGMNGGERLINNTRPSRFVFLLTDGMSTDRKATIDAASNIKYLRLKISAIGVGYEVSHQELLDIASKSELVYSVQDFDSLYTVLKNLVYITCEKCWRSSKTDVAIFLDNSTRVTQLQFHSAQQVLSQFIGLVNLTVNETRVSLTSFDVNFHRRFDFGKYSDKNDIQKDINNIRQQASAQNSFVDTLDLLRYVNSSAFANANNGSKKLAILFINGKFGKPDILELRKIKRQILDQNITAVCVASGSDVDLDPLYDFVNDAFDVYVTDVDKVSQLSVLNSYITYHVCALDED